VTAENPLIAGGRKTCFGTRFRRGVGGGGGKPQHPLRKTRITANRRPKKNTGREKGERDDLGRDVTFSFELGGGKGMGKVFL